ncbi:hypothetical protein SAMD00019534_053470 [Acytostelium subglobosum LB1]|uniref:hypothetical protein n=1 Tax=Acytostelium subglobosum LB1 TaxID=1410327 RepID=UPI000644D61A|nr:hypothetical protein SAMD00019534_053470 [Acytostelium subglobosum LB1]GAM22172.1 hypothetical protein SAMD00019534_053470 [Acytostelium subglobosum LB1]|eukprot:XP_012755272.1 hypothetical protein SAMD00019534_053470 [Acytostelium subglobosum LB1]
MSFTQIVARTPCENMVNGLTTSSHLGKPDFQLALKQHAAYLDTLRQCGCQVTCLEADSRFPDSTFVEDVALCVPGGLVATISRPGAPSRLGEAELIGDTLSKHFKNIEHINAPGTLEAGDVMMAGTHYFIGLSARTNRDGANQLIAILQRYGLTGEIVEVPDALHLKTSVSYLENNTMIGWKEFKSMPQFAKYTFIEVDQDELYCANSIHVNGKILMPLGNPKTKAKLEQAGFQVLEVDSSEFRKIDGGLSCLSLRF